jgi:hypothetical protein
MANAAWSCCCERRSHGQPLPQQTSGICRCDYMLPGGHRCMVSKAQRQGLWQRRLWLQVRLVRTAALLFAPFLTSPIQVVLLAGTPTLLRSIHEKPSSFSPLAGLCCKCDDDDDCWRASTRMYLSQLLAFLGFTSIYNSIAGLQTPRVHTASPAATHRIMEL